MAKEDIEDITGTSVFTDDSGARRRVVVWGLRSVSAVIVLGLVAVVVSVVGNVTLPGLDRPISLPGQRSPSAQTEKQSPRAEATPSRTNGATIGPAAVGPTSRTDDAASNDSRTDGSVVSGTSPTSPAATPTPTASGNGNGKARGKPTAKPTTAAQPTRTPRTPPTEPHGRAKKSTDGS